MKPTIAIPLVLLLAMAGCANPSMQPALPPSSAAPLALAAPAAVSGQDSLPFRSLLVDEGVGRWFEPGADERVVLKSAAELDALLARHARLQPPTGIPVPPRPVPGASVGPPMMEPPPEVVAQQQQPQLEPLPENLTKVDWGKYQLIAYMEGKVDVLTSARITGVFEVDGKLEVRTTRWVAPPNAVSGPSNANRVHIIAIPRTDKAVAFATTTEVDGTAVEGAGGYGVSGGPTMSQVWKAIPNPELTGEKVEQIFKATLGTSVPTSFSVEKRTLSWIKQNMPDVDVRGRFTLDSEVWVGVAEGDLEGGFPGGGGRFSRIVSLFSIEDEFPHPFASMAKPSGLPGGPASPNIKFAIGTEGNTVVLGDPLPIRFMGPAPTEPMKLTMTVGTAAPVVRDVTAMELADGKIKIDKATLPGLTDAASQTLSIKLEYGNAGTGTELTVLRERDVLSPRNPPVQGSGDLAGYNPQNGETAWDAFLRQIVVDHFKGKIEKLTSTDTTFDLFKAATGSRFILHPTTPVKTYEVTGIFPKTHLIPMYSGKGVDEVITPKRLKISLTAELPVINLEAKAYAE